MARFTRNRQIAAKAKNNQQYLGDYLVKASYGHVMDLPKKNIGILLPPDAEEAKKEEAIRRRREAKNAKPAPKPWSSPEEHFEPNIQSDPRQDQSNRRRSAQAAAAPKPCTSQGDRTTKVKRYARDLEEIFKTTRASTRISSNRKKMKKKKRREGRLRGYEEREPR